MWIRCTWLNRRLRTKKAELNHVVSEKASRSAAMSDCAVVIIDILVADRVQLDLSGSQQSSHTHDEQQQPHGGHYRRSPQARHLNSRQIFPIVGRLPQEGRSLLRDCFWTFLSRHDVHSSSLQIVSKRENVSPPQTHICCLGIDNDGGNDVIRGPKLSGWAEAHF